MAASDLGADARVLWRLLRGQPNRGCHAERLQAFYAPQADRYDAFRASLLHGRQELIDSLEISAGDRVVELGCGTGSSLERIGEKIGSLASLQMVDLCPALLDLARQRAARYANVQVVEADATFWQPDEPVDIVFLSYALTMIPDWSAVIANAHAMLRPGGRIGLVDFHLPTPGGALSNFFGETGLVMTGFICRPNICPPCAAVLSNAAATNCGPVCHICRDFGRRITCSSANAPPNNVREPRSPGDLRC